MLICRSALEVPRSATALAVTRVTRQSERVRLLTEDAYKATMGTPMTLVAPDDVRPLKLGDYVRSISGDDFGGHDFSSHDVEKVYRIPAHVGYTYWSHPALRTSISSSLSTSLVSPSTATMCSISIANTESTGVRSSRAP